MDLTSLQLYMAVLKYGSITQASERANITQPALGLHIRKLEQELGVQLLERHSRGITVTEAGRVLALHAETILEHIDLAKAEMTRYAQVPTGRVVIGLTPTVREAIATPLAERISREFSDVQLTIKEALSETLIEYLLDSRIDVALVYNTQKGGEQLTFTPLAVEKMYFVSPLFDGAPESGPITAAEAIRHRLILPTRPHHVRTEIDRVARQLKIELDVSHEVDSVPAIRSFVASGLGWSIMPRPPAWDRTVGAQLVVQPEIRRLLHLAHAKRRPMSRAFEAVLDAVMELVEAERRHPHGQWQPLEAPQRPA